MRAASTRVTLFVVAIAALMVLPSTASAEYKDRGRLFAFSNTAQKTEHPRRVAVEPSTGNAFVVEQTTGVVRVFGPSASAPNC